MNKQEILKRLFNVVAQGLRHANYPRSVKLASDYKKLITGENLNSMLARFTRRESEALFEQRCAITQHVTPAICKNLMDVAYKVPRSNSAVRVLGYSGENGDSNVAKFDDIISRYWGDKSLDDYAATRLIDLAYVDPNAFIVTDIKPFDNKVEHAKPYPFEVSSAEAIDYTFTNNVLDYLIVAGATYYEQPKKDNPNLTETKSKKRYTAYTKNEVILLDELVSKEAKDLYSNQLEGLMFPVSIAEATGVGVKLGGDVYLITEPTPYNLKEVPAIRAGFVPDLVTDGSLMVNPIHAALPYLMKTLKINSELDLTSALVAYPQQLRYVTACPNTNCNGGYTDHEQTVTCKSCNGTGLDLTTSVQEVIALKLPKGKDELIPLDDIMKYVSPDVDIIKWQEEYIDKLTENCKKIVFNTGIFDKKEVAETATGKNLDIQNVYDALYPLSIHFSKAWKTLVTLCAKYTDLDNNLVASYTFGKDFKLKTMDDLLAELEQAVTSGANSALIEQLQMDIARIVYADRPMDYKRYQIQQSYNPFVGKPQMEVAIMLASPFASKRDKVLYTNLSNIFLRLEQEYNTQKKDFYTLDKVAQTKEVNRVLDVIISELEPEEPKLPA